MVGVRVKGSDTKALSSFNFLDIAKENYVIFIQLITTHYNKLYHINVVLLVLFHLLMSIFF
jgi:hypothetical protein